MSTLQAPAPRPKSRQPQPRSIRVLSPGEVAITCRGTTGLYRVSEVPVGGAFDGRGFRCVRVGTGATYDVFLSRTGQDDTCSCPAGTYRGSCKHRHGLRALLSRGKLDDVPAHDARSVSPASPASGDPSPAEAPF